MVGQLQGDGFVVQRQDLAAAPFLGLAAAGEVDEDSSHQAGGNGEEVSPALPFDLRSHQPEVGFVYQGRGLQEMPRAFPAHVAVGLPAQLLVDDGGQLLQRVRVAAAPFEQQLRDVGVLECGMLTHGPLPRKGHTNPRGIDFVSGRVRWCHLTYGPFPP